MRKIGIVVLIVFLSGCVSVPRQHRAARAGYGTKAGRVATGFVELGKFCRTYKLQYSFDTLDDVLTFSSSDIDMKLLLASSLAYYNGRVFSIKDRPYYSKGKIFIPRELESIVSLKPRKPSLPPTLLAAIGTILLDPGHGGKDPGAISKSGLREKDVNLKVAMYLKEELGTRGFRVYLTRDRDKYLTLQQRVDLAKYHNADLFISIHTNANRSQNVKGTEVYYLSGRYRNNHTKSNHPNASKDARKIVQELISNENHVRSVEFANTLAATLKKMGFRIKSPKGAPFYVLKHAYVPSVLVEIGYLSNPHEERLIKKSYYQRQIAKGIALSVGRLRKQYVRLSR